MAGVYTSQHTGAEIDVTVTNRPEVITSSELSSLIPENVGIEKIFILSENDNMYKSDGTYFQCLNNIPYTTTAPTQENPGNLKVVFLTTVPTTYYAGWIYVIYSTATGHPVQHIYVQLSDIQITIK